MNQPAGQPLDLDPIQARANAARSGPWRLYDDLADDGYPGHLWTVQNRDDEPGDNGIVISVGTKFDGEFIAAAREDVPALIAEVRRLRAENDELTAELNGRDEKARKRWIKNQEKQLGLKYADFRAGRWEMDLAMGREMAAAYVAMAKTLLGDAPNYSETKLEFDVKIAESPELYTLVVQRHAPGALTPHEARQRAEAEADRLRAENEQYAETTRRLHTAWESARLRARRAQAERHQYYTALQGAARRATATP